MPWCYVCVNNFAQKNHEESEQHQFATARLVISDADAGFCAFCGLATGKVIELKSCLDLDHAKKLAEARKLLEAQQE